MGRNSLITVAVILGLTIAGCGSSESEPQASNPTPGETPNATNTPATKPPSQSFSNPVVPGNQVVNAMNPPANSGNLIQTTNVTERVNVLTKGRNDPFAQIVGQNPITVPALNTTTAKPVPVLPTLSAANPRSAVASTKSNPASNSVRNKIDRGAIATVQRPSKPAVMPVLPKVLPQVVPSPSLVSVMPTTPQPDLARAVIVTGVVMVGREPQAIIKVPTEPTSRYVQAGQRLANGVLVKRIEVNEGSEPIIILEQYGIEVAKTVGETPTAVSASTTSMNNSVSMVPGA
ncbi:hypothetical protein [Calothrix sp. 336/3]|uniref:hypothetical protein n=1 Tax=Calothrix sp. 336/3 TaxID=1337936 RepID=UPI0004E3B111|nr:hypothetical protein [Calothrix sp. 336/3]AKG23677.1 hypothetical protein IJ00_22440 [Calothrix sp. 336/3]